MSTTNAKTLPGSSARSKSTVQSEVSGSTLTTTGSTVDSQNSSVKRILSISTVGSKKRPRFDDELAKYSLDDMRRLTQKLVDLGVIDGSLIDSYVQDEPGRDRVLCTYDASVQWTSYTIRNQEFTFPDFMEKPVYLARGGFGTVAKCFRYGEPVAVKKVEVPDARHWEMALRLLRELVVMKQAKKLNQRHICKIIDIFGDQTVQRPQDLQHIYIVMPLYNPGALENFAVKDPAMFKTIAGHTLSALHFLHIHKLMHRDIKKENIFFDARKNRAFLADLGQARTWQNLGMSGRGEVGTRCYLSPEILEGVDYDYRSDVYSLGQTWYEVLCMKGNDSLFPYGRAGGEEHLSMQRALDPISTKMRTPDSKMPFAEWANERWGDLASKSERWGEPLSMILEHMLMFNMKNRATTSKLFQLPYFFPFVAEDNVMDLREVETDNYAEIQQRIFDLQHGNCQHNAVVEVPGRKSKYQKMCSMAVEYFDAESEEDE